MHNAVRESVPGGKARARMAAGQGPLSTLALILLASPRAAHGAAAVGPRVTLDAADEAALAAETECTRYVAPQHVIYNRVAKAGSVTMLSMIMQAAKANPFTISHEPGTFPRMHTPALYNKWIEKRLNEPLPSLYDAHTWYADISPLPNNLLVWINVVREPSKLFSSLYYYQRDCTCGFIAACRGGAPELRHLPHTIPHFCKNSIDDAWKQWNITYQPGALKYFFPGPGFLVNVFCGIKDPVCHTNDLKRRYELAREHVLHAYLWVGVLEQFEPSLRLLQHMLPSFFGGVDVSMYARMHTNPGATHLDTKPSPSTLREIKAQLYWDERLYVLCRRLLEVRMRACGVRANATNVASVPNHQAQPMAHRR